MAKLAIIFGAGASYDFVPTYPPPSSADPFYEDRIPLANQLFKNREAFARIAEQLRRLPQILPILRTESGRSVEEVLEDFLILEKGHRYWVERQKELMLVRFYLQEAIWYSEKRMVEHSAAVGVSNYKTLIGFIEEFRTSNEPVILITFNYDTLIETSTFGAVR